MAYTTHGHHIEGTKVEGIQPPKVARCGGPGLCDQCSREVSIVNAMSHTSIQVLPEDKMTVERIDEIIKAYAKKAHEIYVSRTAGDYTWIGFLASFLTDVNEFRRNGLLRLEVQNKEEK